MGAPQKNLGGRPTKATAAATAPRILDAARAAFALRGVAGASLDEIARELRVSKHTIYRRFPNKLALLEAVVERDIVWFRAELSAAAASAEDALEALRRTALRYVEIGVRQDHAALYLAVQTESSVAPTLRDRLAAWSQTALAPLSEALTRAGDAGLLEAGVRAQSLEILVDLLEGVNNRRRFGAVRDEDLARTFELRWVIFTKAFAPPIAR